MLSGIVSILCCWLTNSNSRIGHWRARWCLSLIGRHVYKLLNEQTTWSIESEPNAVSAWISEKMQSWEKLNGSERGCRPSSTPVIRLHNEAEKRTNDPHNTIKTLYTSELLAVVFLKHEIGEPQRLHGTQKFVHARKETLQVNSSRFSHSYAYKYSTKLDWNLFNILCHAYY